jgi:hypothetical protein
VRALEKKSKSNFTRENIREISSRLAKLKEAKLRPPLKLSMSDATRKYAERLHVKPKKKTLFERFDSLLDKISAKNEEWMEVREFPNYEISRDNGIRNKSSKKIIKGRNWIGYPKVTLMRDGKKHERRIHKLVAEHFVPNPKGLSIVNHDDSNRSNYRASNLTWMSQSENMKHRWATDRAGVKKIRYGHEHGKNKMITEDLHETGGENMKALNKYASVIIGEEKTLKKMSRGDTRGRNSLFARINRAKKIGIKFRKKSATDYIKIQKALKKMKRRSTRG